jgi:hypothetical protein
MQLMLKKTRMPVICWFALLKKSFIHLVSCGLFVDKKQKTLSLQIINESRQIIDAT